MSDPVTPAAPDATAPAPSAPAPTAAPAQTAAPVAPQPPRVNPWALRPAAPAAKPASVAAPAAPPASSEPVAAPQGDPRVDALMGVLAETVAQDLSVLPPNVASSVRAIAGDDPVAQRKAINAMRANGLAAVSSSAPLPMPANTSPAAVPAPAPSSTAASDAAIAAKLAELQRVAPIRAVIFRQQNAEALARHAKSLAS